MTKPRLSTLDLQECSVVSAIDFGRDARRQAVRGQSRCPRQKFVRIARTSARICSNARLRYPFLAEDKALVPDVAVSAASQAQGMRPRKIQSMIATARVQPAEPPRTFTGKQL